MTRTIQKWSGLAGLVALATSLATGQARADFDDVYSAGHADVNLSYDSSSRSLNLNYEITSNARINGVVVGAAGAGVRDADTITILVGANGLGVGSANLPAPFASNPLWTLPQTSSITRPFLGLGAEEIEFGIFRDETLTLAFSSFVQRPAGGEFIVWQLGSEANPLVNSVDGLSSDEKINLFAGGHDHYTYGFTREGIYDVNIIGSGTLLDGTTISTSAVYRFQVGNSLASVPEPASLVMLGLGLGGAAFLGSRARKVA